MFRNCLRIFQQIAVLTLVGAVVTACSTTTYKADVVQGNFVSREQVAALRVGMPKVQVRNILGTPLLTDIFHADRWDYVFTIESKRNLTQPRRLTVHFKGDTLDKWDGDTMPSEIEFVQSLDSGRKIGKIPTLVASEKELADFAARQSPVIKPAASSAASAILPSGAKTYPPLETQ
jgi:outer membrane protein assembly factor BamE